MGDDDILEREEGNGFDESTLRCGLRDVGGACLAAGISFGVGGYDLVRAEYLPAVALGSFGLVCCAFAGMFYQITRDAYREVH